MKVKRVVYASSILFTENPVLPKVETMVPNPLSPYAVSKLTGEKYCSNISQEFTDLKRSVSDALMYSDQDRIGFAIFGSYT
ncbi:MAG: NAD-dependent epimerase/dehydratase family protein [Ignavibacteria bacterium]